MLREVRTAVYGGGLRLEAYRLQGIARPFPAHFHDYYVIGLVERGSRRLRCQNRDYTLAAGDMLLLNIGDSHGCAQCDGGTLDYRGLNLPRETMRALLGAAETDAPPRFSQPVISEEETACCLRAVHQGVMDGGSAFEGEELLRLFLALLFQDCGQAPAPPPCRAEIARACAFMRTHYAEGLSLEEICRHAGLSPSTLLRAFTRETGVTPYRYLQAVRIGEAKKLLAAGIPPADAALRTGFSDQSHFTNDFTRFIGLTPGAYRDMFSGEAQREGDNDEK